MARRPVLFVAVPALVAVAGAAPHATPTSAPAPADQVLELDWKELLPESERGRFTAVAPPPLHDARGEAGPPAPQEQDFGVNKALQGVTVRLPGFIVPLAPMQPDGLREFLLIPYFGACIHVPPPPPNQIVYVHTGQLTSVGSIYDAYWITGKLHLQTHTTPLAAAAYDLSAEKIEPYRY